MMKIILIEDEQLIARELKRMLLSLNEPIEVIAMLRSVEESISYLSSNEKPDLIFSDIHLTDGLSFEIFNAIKIDTPVVFVTAFDDFLVNALSCNTINYLLKPVDKADIEKVVLKYRNLENHFHQQQKFIESINKKKSRLIVKKGLGNIPLKVEDIALIYTESKITFVYDREGSKYVCERNLAELESCLDEQTFFRANRQYIINVEFIKSYKTCEKVKLQVDLAIPLLNHQIVISQEVAPHFRRWISQA